MNRLLLLFLAFFVLVGCEKDNQDPNDPNSNGNNNNNSSTGLSIGDLHEGGVIAYLDGTGDHGFVVSIDYPKATEGDFGCMGTNISTSSAIGTGQQNTVNIVNNCSATLNAAYTCDNWSEGGYSDWYSPSLDELYEIMNNLTAINTGLTTAGGVLLDNNQGTPWHASTQYDINQAYKLNLFTGNLYINNKNTGGKILPIRSF